MNIFYCVICSGYSNIEIIANLISRTKLQNTQWFDRDYSNCLQNNKKIICYRVKPTLAGGGIEKRRAKNYKKVPLSQLKIVVETHYHPTK